MYELSTHAYFILHKQSTAAALLFLWRVLCLGIKWKKKKKQNLGIFYALVPWKCKWCSKQFCWWNEIELFYTATLARRTHNMVAKFIGYVSTRRVWGRAREEVKMALKVFAAKRLANVSYAQRREINKYIFFFFRGLWQFLERNTRISISIQFQFLTAHRTHHTHTYTHVK